MGVPSQHTTLFLLGLGSQAAHNALVGDAVEAGMGNG